MTLTDLRTFQFRWLASRLDEDFPPTWIMSNQTLVLFLEQLDVKLKDIDWSEPMQLLGWPIKIDKNLKQGRVKVEARVPCYS